jgi:hypothetical protein
MDQVDGQYLHNAISILKGVPEEIIGIILS